jgi:hypothetical protein
MDNPLHHGDEQPWVFAGHSDFVAGLAGYDIKTSLIGTEPGQIPDAGLAPPWQGWPAGCSR